MVLAAHSELRLNKRETLIPGLLHLLAAWHHTPNCSSHHAFPTTTTVFLWIVSEKRTLPLPSFCSAGCSVMVKRKLIQNKQMYSLSSLTIKQGGGYIWNIGQRLNKNEKRFSISKTNLQKQNILRNRANKAENVSPCTRDVASVRAQRCGSA